MILTVTPNPCVDKTIFVDHVKLGTIIRSTKATAIAGGKGTNVSRVVKALGRPTKALQIVGGHTGAHIEEMIRVQDVIETVSVWVSAPSREIVTVLDTSEHVQTAYMEPGPELTEEEVANVYRVFEDALHGVSIVTFNGTVPCSSLSSLYFDLIRAASKRGIKTILDAHGPAFAEGVKAQPFMVKPNIEETEELFKERFRTDKDILNAISKYHALGTSLVVISMGAQGAVASFESRVLRCVPPQIREVNPVGSGDALVAGFAVGLMEEMEFEQMCRLGVGAGTANATSWDIGHCSRAEIEHYATMVEITRIR